MLLKNKRLGKHNLSVSGNTVVEGPAASANSQCKKSKQEGNIGRQIPVQEKIRHVGGSGSIESDKKTQWLMR